jgi:hypothetical protein
MDDPLEMDRQVTERIWSTAANLNQIHEGLLMGIDQLASAKNILIIPGCAKRRPGMTVVIQFTRQSSPQPGPAAALAFHHLVALLEQALAFAILALRLLLDVGASFIGHDNLPAMILCTRTKAAFSTISKAYSIRGPP